MSLEETLRQGFDAFGRADYHTAAECARAVMRESPKNAGALTLTGRLALVSQRLDVALPLFVSLTEQECAAETWLDLARTLVALRREEDAIEAIRAAASLDHGLPAAPMMLGDTLVSLNRRDEAIEAYRRVLAIDYAHTGALLGLSRVASLGVGSPEVARMHQLLTKPLPSRNIAEVHYALSTVYKRHGEDKKFIEHFFAANDAQKQEHAGAREFYARTFDALESAFTLENMSQARGAPGVLPAPIFVLGQPRSGTTLIEQVVSQHPDVVAGGELEYMREVLRPALQQVTGKPFPEGWHLLKPEQFRDLGLGYSSRLRALSNEKPWVTDKSPGNFHLIGLLPFLFPNGKIIHVRRDPMDNCFSILQQPFLDRSPHTYDINLMAYAYARYQRLMNLWQRAFPDRIHTVQYEDFVANSEAEGRRLLEACGLEWNPSFLDFHRRTKSAVHTFSATQVRQAVHSESVGAWRKYERALEPLRKALVAEGVLQ